MTKFQIILTGIFGFFIVVGIIIFSAYRGSGEEAVRLTVWGTMSSQSFDTVIKSVSLHQNKQFDIRYVEKSEANFDADFVEALASGVGPDIVMLSNDRILKHYNKIFPIPYSVFTERQFKDSFIEGSEIYMSPSGTLALPFSVDPLVMYWNRTIFRDVRITEPPKYWDEFYSLATTISKKDGALNIQRSAVSFGEFSNIANAKKIILNLAMQAGAPVTSWEGNSAQIAFAGSFGKPVSPAEAAVNFYTEFGNPSKASYSWNRSLPNSTNYFLGGDLALYFGFASEARVLQLKNPNLNFDVALVPVSREGGEDISYADFNGFAITKASPNKNAAFALISILTNKDTSKSFSEALNLPSPRRDLLSVRASTAHGSIFNESVIRSKSWLDPDSVASDAAFRTMIESITSGRVRTTDAINRVQRELMNILQK